MHRVLRDSLLFLCLVLTFAAVPVVAQASHSDKSQSGASDQSHASPQGRLHGVPWRDANAPVAFAAPTGARLAYFGGPVISNVHVVQVLYGDGAYLPQVAGTTSPNVGTFFSDITSSGFITLLSQYNTPALGGTNQVIGNGTF